MNERPLNTDAFLNVFTVFGLTLVFFVVAYFLVRLIKARVSFGKYAASNNLSTVFDFLLGSLFGAGSFACAFLQDFFAVGMPTLIIVDFVFAAAWLFSYRFFLGSSLLTFGSLIYNRSNAANDSEWIMNIVFWGVVFLLLAVFNIAKRKLPWINTGLFLLFVMLVLHSLAVVVFYVLPSLKASADFYVVNIAASFLFGVFGYWLALLVDRGLFGTKKLSTLARYDYEKFVKQAFVAEELHSYVVKKGFTHGALLSFYTSRDDLDGADQRLYDAVKKRYANNDCLLISLASRYPSVFVPLSGNFNNTTEIEASIRALASVAVVDLKKSLGETFAFKAFFSIYGLHADSVLGLMRINLNFLLSPNAFLKSRLTAYSPQKAIAVEVDASAVGDFLNLSSSWGIEYSIQKLNAIGGQDFYGAQLTSVPLIALSSEQCFERIEPRLLKVAQRYYAMKILRDFFITYSDGIIIVYYPIGLFLARDFSFKVFLGKTEGQGFDLKRIVFCLNILPNAKPSVFELRRLDGLMQSSKAKLNFAIRSSVGFSSPIVDYVLLGDHKIVKNATNVKKLAKVHYHK